MTEETKVNLGKLALEHGLKKVLENAPGYSVTVTTAFSESETLELNIKVVAKEKANASN